MFEYLMPALWMRTYPDTLLERSTQSCSARTARRYADERRAFPGAFRNVHTRRQMTVAYQYRAFGIPQLALQQDAGRLVVAPYATMLALGDRPRSRRSESALDDEEGLGSGLRLLRSGGFHPDVRPSRRQRFALVRAWMAHHQGMSLLAIANLLKERHRLQVVPRRCTRTGDRAAVAGTAYASHCTRCSEKAPEQACCGMALGEEGWSGCLIRRLRWSLTLSEFGQGFTFVGEPTTSLPSRPLLHKSLSL